MSANVNPILLLSAAITIIGALLHFACVPIGAPLLRFLGAGEEMIGLSMKGHWYPSLVSVVVGLLLSVVAGYTLSAADMWSTRLPFAKFVLGGFVAVLLIRAMTFPFLQNFIRGNSQTFWIVSSAICAAMAALLAIGLYQQWSTL